jgi:hypothetical protein
VEIFASMSMILATTALLVAHFVNFLVKRHKEMNRG